MVPALAALAAGCGDGVRLHAPPAPVPADEIPLAAGAPAVRILSPKTAEATAAPTQPSPLDSRRIDRLQLEGAPLDAACQMLTRLVGTNIVASANARKQLVTLYMLDVPARSAIEGLCRLHGLWYREDPGLVRILTAAEYGSELVIRHEDETRLYYLRNASAVGVADLLAALMPEQISFNRPAEEASFGHVGTDGDDPMGNGTGSGSTATTVDGTIAVNGMTTSSTVQRSSYGGTSVNVGTGQQAAVSQAQALQAAGDAGRGSTSVGTRSLLAHSARRGGATVSVFLRNNCIAVRAVDETLHREIGQIIAELDTPTRQVLLELKILQVGLSNGFESFFNFAYQDSGPPQVSASFLQGASLSGNTVSFGILDSKISASMQLLQTDGRMRATASPMLLSANNAPAEFFSGVTRMITTSYDFETRYNENGVATDIARPVVSEREIGTQVRIKPSINDDGTVTLRFYLQIGTVNAGCATISEIVNNEVVQLPIDTVDNNRVTSIVVANHGQSVVMGGLISESASFQHQRVPGLGDIPALGMLFRKNNDNITRTETVVIITPHIMGTPGDAGAVSRGVLGRQSTHPWVRHDRSPVTMVDEEDGGRVKAIEFPAAGPGAAAPADASPDPGTTP